MYQARFCQKLRAFHVTDPEINCWTGFVTWWGGDGFHDLRPSGKAPWTFQGPKSRGRAMIVGNDSQSSTASDEKLS